MTDSFNFANLFLSQNPREYEAPGFADRIGIVHHQHIDEEGDSLTLIFLPTPGKGIFITESVNKGAVTFGGPDQLQALVNAIAANTGIRANV